MRTLSESLGEYDNALLRGIADRLGLELTSNRHSTMVEEISQALLDEGYVAELVSWLSEEEREALDALVMQGGQMRSLRFGQRFGKIRRFGPGSLARDAPWRDPISPAEGLWYQGLMARGFVEESGTVIECFFVPSDLLPLLPPPKSERKPFAVPLADQTDVVVLGDLALIDDLCTLLAWIQTRNVRVKADEFPEEQVEQLREQLLGEDGPRLQFLYHLARKADLIHIEGRSLHLSRDPARAWLKQSRAEQIWTLQETWSKDPTWNDLWHVSSLHCEDTGWHNDPLAAREAILGLLTRCWTEAWLSIPGFVDAIHERVPDFARPDGDFESWYIRDARTGEYLSGMEHWDRVEGALLRYVLSGPLHWLGIVSLGYKEGRRRPFAFHLTPWGTNFLGLSQEAPQELPTQPAQIAPDGTVILSREAALSDRFQLARIADGVASGSEYHYQVTPSSLGRALSEGIEVERIERFLERLSDGDVPAATVARIRSWAQNYGQVRMRRATILETRTAHLMGELRAHERIQPYLRQALSPTIAVVRDSDWPILIKELYLAGYLPEIIEH